MKQRPVVIINADDFGHTPGVTAGIIKSYTEGVLTSTTILANLMQPTDSLKNLTCSLIKKPEIGFGVHLNQTFGPPINNDLFTKEEFDRPHRDSGLDAEWQDKVWRPHFAQLDPAKIEREYTAQIEAVIAQYGMPDHLDSHNGISGYPPTTDVFYSLAKKYSLPIRPIAPISNTPMFGGDFQTDAKYITEARSLGIKAVDKAIMRYYYMEEDSADKFYHDLEQLTPGTVTEFMFHPSLDDSMGAWRIHDLQLLTNPQTIAKIKELDLELATYKSAGVSLH